MQKRWICLIAGFLGLVSAMEAQQNTQRLITVEGLPDKIQARLEVMTRAAANAERAGAFTPQYFIYFTKRWPNATTKPITVAFLGGDDKLRQSIKDVASEWSSYGEIHFDFMDSGKFREWSRSDTTLKADIRVAFDGIDGPGYWSMIGVDSSDPTLIAPNEASLELQGFSSSLPGDWQATVRHEFGHALGLMHEHQMPVGGCDQDFRWEDDPGYVPTQDSYGQYIEDSQGLRPGIYTMLAGAPNFWPKDKVDANMKQLVVNSSNYDFGSFDKTSIMKYYFDDRLFRNGKKSHCYSDENLSISKEDQQGIGKWYPHAGSAELNTIMRNQAAFKKSLPAVKLQEVQKIQPIK